MTTQEAIALLQELIKIQSFSREENETAKLLADFLNTNGVQIESSGNNIWAKNKFFDAERPTILLNSHHDTVRPNASYTRDPFLPTIENGKLYGLGSNDAGASLVCLLTVFLKFYDKSDLQYNLIYAATAEEEISGENGIESILDKIGPIDTAIVGEPTQMNMALAEKGLMVLDCLAKGEAGHAARNEGINAISLAMKDIDWFHGFEFPKKSEWLGPVKMSVTQIEAGTQHNVVPDQCKFVVDVRSTDAYSNDEILAVIKRSVRSEVMARSTRLIPSSISENHPLVLAGKRLGLSAYGSPTMSDQALLNAPSLKIGPGDSARSHSADEYIELKEIEQGIAVYQALLGIVLTKENNTGS